jgi:peptide/nickel transport system ATP-binding protein
VPDLADPPPGCRFIERCPFAFEPCVTAPPLETIEDDQRVACWHVTGGRA